MKTVDVPLEFLRAMSCTRCHGEGFISGLNQVDAVCERCVGRGAVAVDVRGLVVIKAWEPTVKVKP